MADPEADDALEGAILAYLREHPAAMDSLEAIAEWWVMRRVVRVVEAVERVLERLTRAGVLEVITAGGERRYRLYPFVPGYHLRRITYGTHNDMAWWAWLRAAKRVPGTVFLVQSRRQSGLAI